MTENLLLGVIGLVGFMNAGALTLLVSLNYKIGKLNGTVARHDAQLRACPLCPDKGGYNHGHK